MANNLQHKLFDYLIVILVLFVQGIQGIPLQQILWLRTFRYILLFEKFVYCVICNVCMVNNVWPIMNYLYYHCKCQMEMLLSHGTVEDASVVRGIHPNWEEVVSTFYLTLGCFLHKVWSITSKVYNYIIIK